jgi:hypothetical protein
LSQLLYGAEMTESDDADAQGSEIWRASVEVLTTWPDLVESLMALHRPTSTGLCLTCAVPGGTQPDLAWPCSLWTLADTARRERARRRLGD